MKTNIFMAACRISSKATLCTVSLYSKNQRVVTEIYNRHTHTCNRQTNSHKLIFLLFFSSFKGHETSGDTLKIGDRQIPER